MEAAWGAIAELFTFKMMLLALTGTVLGMVWGAMPALSTTMAMALLVGLTVKMSTYGAILFLMSIMVSSVYGGSITAVLINIPGTPASICTAIEGYPLTLKGEGGLALGTAIVASFMGNWAGTIAVMIFVPLVMAIAMKFGAWELFLLAFWGITICGTLVGGEKPIKGWISGWLGLLIAMVGVEPIHGVHRFTFDLAVLIDGVGEIPIIIGLFGLTEVLKALSSPQIDLSTKPVGRIIPSFSLLWQNIGTTLRASFIGLIIGALPAAGPNIASFLAYIVEKQKAKGEELAKFGKGSYKGLIASEVANNACIGGDLLPTTHPRNPRKRRDGHRPRGAQPPRHPRRAGAGNPPPGADLLFLRRPDPLESAHVRRGPRDHQTGRKALHDEKRDPDANHPATVRDRRLRDQSVPLRDVRDVGDGPPRMGPLYDEVPPGADDPRGDPGPHGG